MGRLSRFISLCILFVSSNLAGCTGSTVDSTLPPLTFEPISTVVITGDCTLTPDLEAWLQAAEFRVEAFTDFVQTSENKKPNELRAGVLQLEGILQSVGNTAVVDCAVDLNEQLRQVMTDTLQKFQGYVNLERDDLAIIRTESSAEFEPIQNGLAELKEVLDSRLRGGTGE